MRLNIFAVRDHATDQFGNPMFLITIGQAIRSFTDEVNRDDKDNMLNRHPEDYAIYHLGEYETQHALFIILDAPKQLVTGKEVFIKG